MVAALAFAAVASAQPKAVGVRVGNGAEVSYQHYLGGSNFIEADLGFMSNGFRLTGIYDFDLGSAGNFNFYVGPGASLGFVNGTDGNGNAKTYFSAAVVGQVGAEFAVPGVPLNFSLDWRPAIYFTDGTASPSASGTGSSPEPRNSGGCIGSPVQPLYVFVAA